MAKYTVHNIPYLLKPFFLLFGWFFGIGFCLHNFLFRKLCRIEYIGSEHVNNTPNFIFSVWHENLTLYFIAHPRFKRNHIWLTFPLWFMKPVHIMKKIIGIKELAYGASGHDGKKALNKVLKRLSEGWSTFLSPDGPAGPMRQMKDGALIMSMKTNTPIIPMSFQVAGNWRLNTWDKKRYPPLFSTFKVIYGKPIYVTKENFEQVRTQVAQGMNEYFGQSNGNRTMPKV